jgi:hypothetical protein
MWLYGNALFQMNPECGLDPGMTLAVLLATLNLVVLIAGWTSRSVL